MEVSIFTIEVRQARSLPRPSAHIARSAASTREQHARTCTACSSIALLTSHSVRCAALAHANASTALVPMCLQACSSFDVSLLYYVWGAAAAAGSARPFSITVENGLALLCTEAGHGSARWAERVHA